MKTQTIIFTLFLAILGLGVSMFSPGDAHAFRVIEAMPTDGTYCEGMPVRCDADATITRWFVHTVPYWVNQDAAVDAADPDPNLNQADIISAVRASYQTWQDVPFSFIKFDYQGTTTARIAADGINTTLFYNPALDTAACVGWFGLPGGTLGVTILTEDLPLGEIVDADVVIDSGDDWEWSTACTDLDLQTTLTHEYGHSVGIHHTEVDTGVAATQPSMYALYFCDPGTASGRSLEADDEAALQCLYPEQPTVVLMDQTGSMSAGSRMADAQASADSFVLEMADNLMAVTAFADWSGCSPARDGYELIEDWTDVAADLQVAVAGTSPCGSTPLWESACCAIGKARELEPGNVLIFTDTEENASDAVCSSDCPAGYCGCISPADVGSRVAGADVAVYVIDITDYAGTLASVWTSMPLEEKSPNNDNDRPECLQKPVNADGEALMGLARVSGGLYCSAFNPKDLEQARIAVLRHMGRFGRDRQNPPTCRPKLPIDDVQVYAPDGKPVSAYIGKRVELVGSITVPAKTFDLTTHYIEDCTGGIQVSVRNPDSVKPGDRVRVLGWVQDFLGELRLTKVEDIRREGSGAPLQAPIVDPSILLQYEMVGKLARVKGYVVTDVFNHRFLLGRSPKDEQSAVTVLIDPDTGIDPGGIKAGQEYVITGIVSKRGAANELKPRGKDDLVWMPGPKVQVLSAREARAEALR